MDHGEDSGSEDSSSAGYGIKCSRANLVTSVTLERGGAAGPMEALTINVSHRGMGFYVPERIEVGKEVLINITYFPGGDAKWVETVCGVVKWCRPIGNWHGAGVEFKYLDPDQQSLLISYIESALQFHHVHPH